MRWLTTALVALLSLGLPLLGEFFAARSQSPEADPNLSFEMDVTPQDEKPDGWVLLLAPGAEFEYKRGSAAAGRWCVVLKNTKSEHWARIGLPASTIAKPDTWYKLRYWALVRGDSVRCGWRLASKDLKEVSDELGLVEDPVQGNNKWHLTQTRAFKISAAQLERYPMLAFCLDPGLGAVVDLDDIAISRSAPD